MPYYFRRLKKIIKKRDNPYLRMKLGIKFSAALSAVAAHTSVLCDEKQPNILFINIFIGF